MAQRQTEHEEKMNRLLALSFCFSISVVLVVAGCDNASSGSRPLPFPKGYKPKNPPIEKRDVAPPEPVQETPLGVGDRVSVKTAGWDSTIKAMGVIIDGPYRSGEVQVFFVDRNGAPYKIVLPASILSRQ